MTTKQEAHEKSRKDTIDQVVYKRTDNYKLRAQRDIDKNPDHYKALGKIGGSVSGIKKGGFGDPEKAKLASLKGVEARRRNQELKNEKV